MRFDAAAEVAALENAARESGVPLRVLDIKPAPGVKQPSAAIYNGSGLVLSRPDQHVAWRGDRVPADPRALIDRVRGAANREPYRF